MSIFFSHACSYTFSDAAHSSFWCQDPKLSLLGLLKMLVLPSLKSSHFTWGSLSTWRVLGLSILAYVNFLFSRVFSRVWRCGTLAFFVWGSQTMLTWLFKDATFGPSSNLHTWISLVEVYRFGPCLAFIGAVHSRFSCWNPELLLLDFLKMLVMALPQIYTRVFYLW